MNHTVELSRPAVRGRAVAGMAACLVAIVAAGVSLSSALSSGCADVEDRPASWSYVYATIVRPNCTTSNCHTQPTSTAGLRFETRESAYNYLTGNTCETIGTPDPALAVDHNFVVPFQPDSSKLMYMLRGQEVRNMPPDVPLPEVEIDLIAAWILEGAPCN